MLARKMKLKLNGSEVGTTPMLVPSFSSKANIDVRKKILNMNEYITTPILISAYDVRHVKNFPSITFPNMIFLDSGGYECLIEKDVSELGVYQPKALLWNRDEHLTILQNWKTNIPTVVISYDSPSERKSTEEQINDANDLFHGMDNVLKEILLKPEKEGRIRIHLEDIIKNLNTLSSFDIIGFTEKELGYSILDRMVMIAKLRIEMDKRKIQVPIHIFGSLDSVTTPLYYFSGADIFDGLAWIRFIFHDEFTLYSSFGPKKHGIDKNVDLIHGLNLVLNYNYILDLQKNLEKFQFAEDFNYFGKNADFFKDSYKHLKIKLKEVN